MIEMCTRHQGVYDIIHMLIALPLLPTDRVMEGFASIIDFYSENVQNNLPEEFDRYFQYYKSTWLQGM